jgi:glutamate-1-semialdehyde aminotransferase
MPNDPLSDPQRRYLERFGAAYRGRMAGSLARREQAFPALADARSSQGYFAEMPEKAREHWIASRGLRFPIVAERCEGAHAWDIDGNRYVDYCLGFGVHLFGHRPQFVESALRAQLERGLAIGFQSEHANEVAAAIATMTGAERVALCNTGAEAVMGAIRLARAATGRETIAVFAQAYHGSYDATLPALGMHRGLTEQDTLVLEYGAARSLEVIADRAESLAAVVVEPVQARSPALQPAGFLRQLRELTQGRGVALIFDDVLLGFRIHQGGSQAHFGVRADLATFGKIIGGGMPCGAVTGSARFLDAIDGGRWSSEGAGLPRADKVWFAGTFTKNPMTMAAAQAVTQRLQAAGCGLQEGLNARAAGLAMRLNEWLVAQEMPVRVECFGSMFRLMFAPALWILLPHLRMRGVYAFDGASFFLSTAHGEAEVAALEDAVKDSLEAMRTGGYIA